jgi:hypothetical protein
MPDRREHLFHERFIRYAYEHVQRHEDDACKALKKINSSAYWRRPPGSGPRRSHALTGATEFSNSAIFRLSSAGS